MIYLFSGENDFAVKEALRARQAALGIPMERVQGADLTAAQLPDLLMGVSLFASERFVVIEQLSDNTALWEKLPDWLPRIADDITVVFVEAKPDKRTAAYKALKAAATVEEFPVWAEKDSALAKKWLLERAKAHGIALEDHAAAYVVDRVGVDQWRLASALDTLSLLEDITPAAIDDAIPANLSENVFQLFEVALKGDGAKVSQMIATLSLQEDAYALFALLSSQVQSLAVIAFKGDDNEPTKDFAIHPFVASKLTQQAKRYSKPAVARMLTLFAKADADLKRSRGEPWLVGEKLLLEITQLAK